MDLSFCNSNLYLKIYAGGNFGRSFLKKSHKLSGNSMLGQPNDWWGKVFLLEDFHIEGVIELDPTLLQL